MGTYETPVNTPFTAIPYAMPTPVPSGDDILTVLLLGSDTTFSEIAARTDVIIAVAINRTRGTVSMLHFPRDLLVYVPNHTMAKINTVFQLGNQRYGAGGGAWLMKEMMRYNFGLHIDFYARVDFNRFQEIIRQLDGLEISVDCAVQGNRLISPDLDPELPESYEVYTLNIGLHRLDPYMALWYVRARGSSSDIDRGRRQMEVLRAIWRQARGAGLLAQATVLWPEVQRIVETDLSLTDILGLAPLALSIDPANIQRLTLRQNVHFTEWYTADTGSFVWLPEREAWQEAIQNFMLPPPRNRLGGESPTVEIGVSRALQGYDQVAADRLAWEGYSVRLTGTDGVPTLEDTVIYDYTGGAKPNSLDTLRRVLRLTPANIINQPDPNATVDFRIEMGRSYGRSCMFSLPSQ
jgi:LCP family protein required for cell wall assembly